MEVVDSTSIMNLQFVQEERLKRAKMFPETSDGKHEPTWTYLKPHVDRIPARAPTVTAPPGVSMRSAQAPTATPPARVAFCRCSMDIFLFLDTRQLMMTVAMVQLARE